MIEDWCSSSFLKPTNKFKEEGDDDDDDDVDEKVQTNKGLCNLGKIICKKQIALGSLNQKLIVLMIMVMVMGVQ
ncbi:hypothetical protein M0802_005878 [Mischocyttarus mexicanus]|nr:hypothetical protein M0802_005878 [Mischocyttarus mexicanus]